MKHPFAVGLGVGAAGLILWMKRGWIMGLLHRAGRPLRDADLNGAQFGAAATALRHIRRYAFAAAQDQSPIVGLTHASYALNGLDMLEEAGGGEAIRAAGFEPAKVRALISALQDKHALALRHADPYIVAVLGTNAGFALDGAAPMGA